MAYWLERLPWKSQVWSPPQFTCEWKARCPWTRHGNITCWRRQRAKCLKSEYAMFPLVFQLNRFSPDQDMNRQTDNGHFPPTVVCKGHCELRTIISTVLKASFETTDLSLLAGGCKKNIRNIVFGEKWGAWIIDEPLLAMFGPPVQSGANGYRCLWFPSNCFTWELNSNAERVGSSEKETREWNYLQNIEMRAWSANPLSWWQLSGTSGISLM